MSAEPQTPAQVSEPDPASQIYKATYSGVPVWEFRLVVGVTTNVLLGSIMCAKF